MSYLLQFNGVVFPDTLRPSELPQSYDLGETERPRQPGSITQTARAKSRVLIVSGDVHDEDPATLAALLDTLKAAWTSGTPAPLFFGRNDRSYRAQVQSITETTGDGLLFGLVHTLSVSFLCAQPFALGTAPETVSFPAGESPWTLDAADGDVAVPPLWTLTLGTGGTGPVTFGNSATQETCSLSPINADGTAGTWAAGDVLTIDRDGYGVALNGTARFGMLSGVIPRLVPGSQQITLTAGGTATVSAFTVTYTPRWA